NSGGNTPEDTGTSREKTQASENLGKKKGRQLWGKSCRQHRGLLGECPRCTLIYISYMSLRGKPNFLFPLWGTFCFEFAESVFPEGSNQFSGMMKRQLLEDKDVW
ncbi:MAG: hypothetical protein VW991_05425, partial [Aquiluna sp.]